MGEEDFTHTKMKTSGLQFSRLSLSWKVLISGFIIILNAGYLTGAINAALSVGLTPESIAEHYGDQTISEAEMAVIEEKGFVEEEVSFDEEEDVGPGEVDEENMHEMDAARESITPQEMTQMAHVHLLGFSLILFAIGTLACLSALPEWIKVTLVGVLFLGFFFDIAGLYLVRFISRNFAWLPVVTGITIGVCLAIISIRVFYELWVTAK